MLKKTKKEKEKEKLESPLDPYSQKKVKPKPQWHLVFKTTKVKL